MMGHLHSIGVPPDQIHFFPGHYHGDFDSTDAIIEAAVDDGFPEFDCDFYRSAAKIKHWKFEIIVHWNRARLYRQIIEEDMIVMVMIDDHILNIDFQFLNWIVKSLDTEYAPFYLLQLGWYIQPNHDEAWMMERGLRGQQYPEEDIVNGLVARGIRGPGNWVTVMSPRGAEILLNHIKNPVASIEAYFGVLSHPDQDKTGLFHFMNPVVSGAPMDWSEDSTVA